MDSRTYAVGNSKIRLIFGDLTTSKAEVLVSSDDYLLSMGGGVSAAILSAGGSQIPADASKMVPSRAGDVIVSTAGDLPAKYIFHAVNIGPQKLALSAEVIVRQLTQRVMRLLTMLGCRSVAFPAIGTGVARIPYEIVASQMAGELVDYLLGAKECYDIELYLMDRWGLMSRDDFFMFFEAFAARTLGLSASMDLSHHVLEPPDAAMPTMDTERMAEAQRRHQVYLMLRHLDARRNKIESDLLQALVGKSPQQENILPQLRQQLEEIQALRRNYEAELIVPGRATDSVIPNSVFVSSTSTDLKAYRQAVRSVIKNLQLKFIGMEEFSPSAQAPADLIRRKVTESQVYLGILGMRYGYVDPGTGLSMTELEYRQAIAADKKICMFVMDQNAPITASMVEDDPVKFAKLIDFRGRIMKGHTCGLFTDPQDLTSKVEATLREDSPVCRA